MVEGLETVAFDVMLLARGHIRSRTRTPTYVDHADRFSAAFLGRTLGVPPDYYKAAGTDAATIIDTCYEQLVPKGERAAPLLKEMTRQLQDMADLSLAAGALPALSERLAVPDCAFLDLSCSMLAALTTLGHASLSQKTSVEVADRWLSLWQARVWRHDHQQAIHSSLSILPQLPLDARPQVITILEIPASALLPKSTTFAGGVREYLANFSDTGAASMALVGALPFAERFSGDDHATLVDFLKDTPELLDLVNGLLRFAQDVSFDDTEPVSSRVAAIAAETRGRRGGRSAYQFQKVESPGEKMRREWYAFSQECRERMDKHVAKLSSHEALHRAMMELVSATCHVAEALTSSPHKA